MEEGKSHLTVVSPMADTPAYRAGVLSGDRIVKIEGRKHPGHHLAASGGAPARQAGDGGHPDALPDLE